jgi:uncharacterized protein (DUF1786 family)
MASIRKTKKLLKMRKQAVEISVKDWDIEDGNKALVTMDCDFEFNKFGVTVVCCNIPCEFIPYWQIGNINTIKL